VQHDERRLKAAAFGVARKGAAFPAIISRPLTISNIPTAVAPAAQIVNGTFGRKKAS
jgi:hypothetical protein